MHGSSKWEHYYENRDLARNYLTLPWHQRRILAFLDYFSSLPTNLRVLDVGCGQGLLLGFLRDLGFENISGIDMSPAAVECARQKNLDVRVAGIFDYQAEEPPDVVVLSEVFEHLDDPKAALEVVSSWLAPGGILYASTPVMDSIRSRLRRFILREQRVTQSQRIDTTHVQAFSSKGFERFLVDGGFTILHQISCYNPIPKIGEGFLGRSIAVACPALGDYLILAGKKTKASRKSPELTEA